MATAYSSLHQVKQVRFPPPSQSKPKQQPRGVPPPPLSAPLATMSTPDPLATARTSSLAGRKRARESDGGDAKIIPRRTKSVGGPAGSGSADSGNSRSKDGDAFKRGLIAVFVPKALAESARGIMGNYNDLLASFLPTPLEPVPALGPLLPLIRSLTANVNLLSPALHGRLVTAILTLPWASTEDRFVKAYIGWAGVLISAHPDWTKEVIGMAVKGLTWRTFLLALALETRSDDLRVPTGIDVDAFACRPPGLV
jgi:RNA polymerase I-specific transcription initiation factor RRN3